MKRHLYFVCPTDYLEPIINSSFENSNYYYTSLGNSVVFDADTIHQIERLIVKHSISEISFVLSSSNSIVSDALECQNFMGIRGLNNFYNEILRQKKQSEVLSQESNRPFIILSYYLNKRIKELQLELANLKIDPIKIGGKIYNDQKKVFNEIYSDLICTEYFSLN